MYLYVYDDDEALSVIIHNLFYLTPLLSSIFANRIKYLIINFELIERLAATKCNPAHVRELHSH